MSGRFNSRIAASPDSGRYKTVARVDPLDLDAIRRDHPLPVQAARIVALRRVGMEWVACCPFHADRSPSFTIFDGGRRFHCFGCGASGDVLDLVQRAYGVDLREAARMLRTGEEETGIRPAAVEFPDALKRSSETEPIARSIWEKASPAAGSLAESYLWSRGIFETHPARDSLLAASLWLWRPAAVSRRRGSRCRGRRDRHSANIPARRWAGQGGHGQGAMADGRAGALAPQGCLQGCDEEGVKGRPDGQRVAPQ
jgi:hypothetical protein